jgi:hypothetical protein
MTEQPDEIKTLRLNVLGKLEVIREPNESLDLPSNARACHLLAMLAFKTEYDAQELVDIFWEGQTLHHPDPKEVDRIHDNLNQVYAAARRTLEIVGLDILKSDRSTVRWIENPTYRLTSDLEEFRELANPDRPAEDWRAALALVRGRVAQPLPRDKKLTDSFGIVREKQHEEVKKVLRQLDPDVRDDILDTRVQHVLAGEYRKDYLREQATRTRRVSESLASAPAPHRTRRSHVGTPRQWLIAGVLTVSVLALAIVAWAVWPGSSHGVSIPPVGSVVDAQTGQVVHYVASRSQSNAPQEVDVLLWICDVSVKPICEYPKTNRPVLGHRGDTFEVWIRLYNELETPVPLLGVTVDWIENDENPGGPKNVNKQVFNVSVVSFNRPDGRQTSRGTSAALYVQMPPREAFSIYTPSYVPGSTVLTSLNPSFRHPLPDGIMQHEIEGTEPNSRKRIWLTDVGAPSSSCAECKSEHVRFIHFRVQIL